MPSPVLHAPQGIPGTVLAAAECGAQPGIRAEAGPVPSLPWVAPACQGELGDTHWPGASLMHPMASVQAPRGLEGQRLRASTANLPPLL